MKVDFFNAKIFFHYSEINIKDFLVKENLHSLRTSHLALRTFLTSRH